MANTPEIRFEGFTDDWEQRKVGDISTITAGGTPSTKEISYWEPKEIPWLASGEVHKKYVHDTEEKISEEGLKNSSAKWVKEGSVLIALAGQGKTRGTAAITRVPITTNQSIAAIKFDDILDADYAFHNLDSRYEELRGISSGDGTRGGLNKQLLSDLAIMFPQIDEQVKIGQYFTNLDNLITLHQRKCDETKELKKFMLQKMFPKKGEKIPEIRFDGFTDDWEQRKLGDVLETVTDYVAAGSFADLAKNVEYKDSPDYAQLVRTMDLKNGFTSTQEVYVDKNAFDYLYRVNMDKECIILPNIGNCGEVYYVKPEDLPYKHNVLGPNAIFVRSETAANNFLSILFQAKDFQAKLKLIVSPNGQTKFNKTELKRIDLILPADVHEQEKIGEYFSTLDHLITLHRRKCDELKEFKKAMLQKMFP